MSYLFKDLQHSAAQIDQSIDDLASHIANGVIHITAAERQAWNAKATTGDVNAEAEARAQADGELQTAINAKASSADLTAEETARANADAKQVAALAELIDSGAKNKLEMTSTLTTVTRYGVTATYDKIAGTITLTGSHLSTDTTAIFEFYSGNAVDQRVIPAGTYHLSGCPAGGSTSTFRGALMQITGAVDTGNGATFTLETPQYAAYRILISGNCDFTGGYTFKPMVCLQDVWEISEKFVPYCPSMTDLYAMIKALQT